MYARSTTFQARPENIDAGIAFVRDEVLPMITRIDGCVGLSFIVDRGSGRAIATSAWTTQETMRASFDQLQSVRDRGGDILGARPQVDEWEIVVLHREHEAPEGACMRVTWSRTDPSNADPAIEGFKRQQLPAMESLSGFCSASLLVDRAIGRAVTSALYENREAMERTRPMADQIRSASAEMGVEITDVAEFEVAMAHLRVPETV